MSINCFPLIVVDDNGVEENELLMISLSLLQGTHNVNFSQQSVTIEIMDNDGEIGYQYLSHFGLYSFVKHH